MRFCGFSRVNGTPEFRNKLSVLRKTQEFDFCAGVRAHAGELNEML